MRLSAVIACLAFVSLIALGQPAKAQQPEACFQTYQTASQFASAVNVSGPMAGNYVMRMYQSGKGLKADQRTAIETEAFGAAYKLSSEHGENLGKETDGMRALEASVVKCDKALGVTEAAIKQPYVDQLECATRYTALAFSYNGQQEKAYFMQRGNFSVAMDNFLLGFDTTPDPKRVQEASKKAEALARAAFPNGQPDLVRIWSLLNASHACDRQYGFPPTQIPQNILDAKAGRS